MAPSLFFFLIRPLFLQLGASSVGAIGNRDAATVAPGRGGPVVLACRASDRQHLLAAASRRHVACGSKERNHACEPALHQCTGACMWPHRPRQRGGGDPPRGARRGAPRRPPPAPRWKVAAGRGRQQVKIASRGASSAQRGGRGLYHRSRTGLACAPHAGAQRRRRADRREPPRRGPGLRTWVTPPETGARASCGSGPRPGGHGDGEPTAERSARVRGPSRAADPLAAGSER
jgi:hypothetical protein